MGQKDTLFSIAKYFKQPVYHYPYDADPFYINTKKVSFVSKLLQLKRRNRLFFHLKNYILQKL